MTKRYRHPGRASTDTVRELELFAMNDSKTYNNCYWPITKAAIKHAEKGRFNAGKLCKAMRTRCANEAIKNYHKEFGFFPVTTADRNVLGAELCKSSISDVKDHLRNK